jgi:hypothetical protein
LKSPRLQAGEDVKGVLLHVLRACTEYKVHVATPRPRSLPGAIPRQNHFGTDRARAYLCVAEALR